VIRLYSPLAPAAPFQRAPSCITYFGSYSRTIRLIAAAR
jgi:hypothetical protein